jgi:hypothetical protein
MINRKVALTLGGALVALMTTVSASTWTDPARTTYLTFRQPVSLPGVELAAGTYIFELADAGKSMDLVRVSSRDRSKVYLMAFTTLVNRPAGMRPDRMVTLGEASRGVAPPIRAWYPNDDTNKGHAFIYR